MRRGKQVFCLCAVPIILAAAGSALAAKRYDSTDVPKNIKTTGTTTSTLEVHEGGPIDNLDVELDITFLLDEHLDVYLVAPDGARVELFTDVGGMGMDFTRTVLDDEAAMSIQEGTAPFTGRYRPEGSLRDLAGKDRQGTWILEVTNDEGWFSGTLNAWALVLGGEEEGTCPVLPVPAEPDPADGATGVPVDTKLSWRLSAPVPESFRLLAATGEEEPDPFTLFELQMDPPVAVRIDESCGVYALDVSPDGELYGCDEWALWKLAVGEKQVSCTRIGDFRLASGESVLMTGLAFHPDGTLYGSTFDVIDYTSVIYTIDEKTALVTEVCRFPIIQGILWAIDFSPEGQLYSAFTELSVVDIPGRQIRYLSEVWATDLDWAPNGFLYAIDNETRMLYQIDGAIGIVVGEYGPYDIAAWGLASQMFSVSAQGDSAEPDGGVSRAVEVSDRAATIRDRQALRDEVRRLRDSLTRDSGGPLSITSLPSASLNPPRTAAAEQDPNRITYDVFLDTVNPPTALVCSDVETQRCDPGGLEICQRYYWQVIAKRACGQTAVGPVWSFTAESVPGDFDKDCDVDFYDLATFASYWLFVVE